MSGYRSRRAAETLGPIAFAEPGILPHYAPDRRVAIEHISLHLSLFVEQRRFEGEATVSFRWHVRQKPYFDLDLDEVEVLTVSEKGASLSFEHFDGKLRIFGAESSATITYRGENPSCGLYFIGKSESAPNRSASAWTQCQDEDGHYLFPCHDHPGVKHSWSLTLEADEGLTLLSNGERGEEHTENGRVIARFEQKEPMPAYLVSFVAAPLQVVESQWRGRQVNYYIPASLSSKDVNPAMGRTPQMMEAFSRVLGVDYPWPRYDQVVVHDFVFGGMENIACTTMAEVLLVDEKGRLEWDPEGLVSHELAHQWFGDLVTCQDWSQGWLNESWATYLESVWVEEVHNETEVVWYRYGTFKGYLGEAASRYQRAIVSYDFREPIDVFDRHLYNKGSCVLWTLRHELGDEAFWLATKNYLNERSYKTAHTRDFQRTFEQTTGRNLDGFFEKWILSPGHPKLKIGMSNDDNLVSVAVKQTQTGKGVPTAYDLKLRIEITDDRGTTTVDLAVRQREQTFVLPLSGELKALRVDPGFRVMAEISFSGSRKLLTKMLADSCPMIATRAARGLLDSGAPVEIASVRKAAKEHPFWGVRSTLVGWLGKRRSGEDLKVVVDLFHNDADARVRRAAAGGLGHFTHDEQVAKELKSALKGELETWHLEGQILRSLGKIRVADVISTLSERLEVVSWGGSVKRAALMGLALTRDESVLETLLSYSQPAKDPRVRAAAAVALATLAVDCEKVREPVRVRLGEMLNEPNYRAVVGTVQALAILKDPSTVPALTRVHRSAPDGRLKRMAYEALAFIRKEQKNPEAVNALNTRMTKLEKDNAELRDLLAKVLPEKA